MQDIRGVLLRGDAQVVRSEEERLAIGLLAAKLRGVPECEWPVSATTGSVFIKLENFSVVSWDYSKVVS